MEFKVYQVYFVLTSASEPKVDLPSTNDMMTMMNLMASMGMPSQLPTKEMANLASLFGGPKNIPFVTPPVSNQNVNNTPVVVNNDSSNAITSTTSTTVANVDMNKVQQMIDNSMKQMEERLQLLIDKKFEELKVYVDTKIIQRTNAS